MILKIKYKKSKIDFSLKDRTLYAILITFGGKVLHFSLENVKDMLNSAPSLLMSLYEMIFSFLHFFL